VSLLAANDITFGSNSWRGDEFEPELRQAIEETTKPSTKKGLTP
jgi:hypothetical protein